MGWRVEFHPAFLEEFVELSDAVQDELGAMVELLQLVGPQLKRPRSDTLNGSKHANMKELASMPIAVSGASPTLSIQPARRSCWSPATSPAARNDDSTKP
ncbi:type II toxin-antitoxin system RelE/ParE family toxin [Rhodopseudomonas sp.]|uniref:type II toxin-antitoxin system RelE/ParE family toxin n=1 Tax=Rhodopseudomonas sp. TaxID=1078 RepID=UPI003455407E